MTTTIARPRDVDSILLRLPSALKQYAVSIAHSNNVSQNAVYATAILTSVIMLGAAPQMGSPENIRALVSQIDSALEDDFPVIGAFHSADWDDVFPFVTMLEDLEVVGNVRWKSDAKNQDTVAYTFIVKKVGKALWPTISQVIKRRLDSFAKEGTEC